MNRALASLSLLSTVLSAGACSPLVELPESFPDMPVPEDNPLTAAKVELGRVLFFDERLSRTGEVSCGSCHLQENAFADPRALSVGVEGRLGERNAPPLFNLAWNTSFFWDGGVKTMEQQVIGPITNPLEMDMSMGEVVKRLREDDVMVKRFEDAFGKGPSPEGITKAIASFERTLVSGDSRFDRYQAGDESALSDEELAGKKVFFGEQGECFHCHVGFNLTNNRVLNNGMNTGDPGAARVTERASDDGKFKVPSLRNVALTAPYMHDGSLGTLEDVVEHYAKGGQGHPNTDPTIHALDLSDADKQALVAFLGALTDDAFISDARHRPVDEQ